MKNLESKKHVFIDNDEARKELILGVLDKYCVPRKVIPDRQEDMFGNSMTWYDIEINVNDKAWEFINAKVKEVLSLENSYDMRCKPGIGAKRDVEKEPTKTDKKKALSFSNLINGLFSGLSTGLLASSEDIEAFFANPNKEITGYSKQKLPKMSGVFSYEELPESIQQVLVSKIPEQVLKSPLCKIKLNITDTTTNISIYYIN